MTRRVLSPKMSEFGTSVADRAGLRYSDAFAVVPDPSLEPHPCGNPGRYGPPSAWRVEQRGRDE
jgi:hypothetical protein